MSYTLQFSNSIYEKIGDPFKDLRTRTTRLAKNPSVPTLTDEFGVTKEYRRRVGTITPCLSLQSDVIFPNALAGVLGLESDGVDQVPGVGCKGNQLDNEFPFEPRVPLTLPLVQYPSPTRGPSYESLDLAARPVLNWEEYIVKFRDAARYGLPSLNLRRRMKIGNINEDDPTRAGKEKRSNDADQQEELTRVSQGQDEEDGSVQIFSDLDEAEAEDILGPSGEESHDEEQERDDDNSQKIKEQAHGFELGSIESEDESEGEREKDLDTMETSSSSLEKRMKIQAEFPDTTSSDPPPDPGTKKVNFKLSDLLPQSSKDKKKWTPLKRKSEQGPSKSSINQIKQTLFDTTGRKLEITEEAWMNKETQSRLLAKETLPTADSLPPLPFRPKRIVDRASKHALHRYKDQPPLSVKATWNYLYGGHGACDWTKDYEQKSYRNVLVGNGDKLRVISLKPAKPSQMLSYVVNSVWEEDKVPTNKRDGIPEPDDLLSDLIFQIKTNRKRHITYVQRGRSVDLYRLDGVPSLLDSIPNVCYGTRDYMGWTKAGVGIRNPLLLGFDLNPYYPNQMVTIDENLIIQVLDVHAESSIEQWKGTKIPRKVYHALKEVNSRYPEFRVNEACGITYAHHPEILYQWADSQIYFHDRRVPKTPTNSQLLNLKTSNSTASWTDETLFRNKRILNESVCTVRRAQDTNYYYVGTTSRILVMDSRVPSHPVLKCSHGLRSPASFLDTYSDDHHQILVAGGQRSSELCSIVLDYAHISCVERQGCTARNPILQSYPRHLLNSRDFLYKHQVDGNLFDYECNRLRAEDHCQAWMTGFVLVPGKLGKTGNPLNPKPFSLFHSNHYGDVYLQEWDQTPIEQNRKRDTTHEDVTKFMRHWRRAMQKAPMADFHRPSQSRTFPEDCSIMIERAAEALKRIPGSLVRQKPFDCMKPDPQIYHRVRLGLPPISKQIEEFGPAQNKRLHGVFDNWLSLEEKYKVPDNRTSLEIDTAQDGLLDDIIEESETDEEREGVGQEETVLPDPLPEADDEIIEVDPIPRPQPLELMIKQEPDDSSYFITESDSDVQLIWNTPSQESSSMFSQAWDLASATRESQAHLMFQAAQLQTQAQPDLPVSGPDSQVINGVRIRQEVEDTIESSHQGSVVEPEDPFMKLAHDPHSDDIASWMMSDHEGSQAFWSSSEDQPGGSQEELFCTQPQVSPDDLISLGRELENVNSPFVTPVPSPPSTRTQDDLPGDLSEAESEIRLTELRPVVGGVLSSNLLLPGTSSEIGGQRPSSSPDMFSLYDLGDPYSSPVGRRPTFQVIQPIQGQGQGPSTSRRVSGEVVRDPSPLPPAREFDSIGLGLRYDLQTRDTEEGITYSQPQGYIGDPGPDDEPDPFRRPQIPPSSAPTRGRGRGRGRGGPGQRARRSGF